MERVKNKRIWRGKKQIENAKKTPAATLAPELSAVDSIWTGILKSIQFKSIAKVERGKSA